MQFSLIENPEESEINKVRHRLQEHNEPFWEVDDKYKFVINLNDENAMLGGIVFTIFGEWLEIDFLWVDSSKRDKGYGRKILEQAETYAKLKGCKMSFLNTFNFQAKPFYEKNGYGVVYTQKNYPVTNYRYFMEKKL
ncbi:MAG: GNAT family N-acetyltransferase [Spirochaetales bacterium]|nr:GNAT family N-acetyltransferase [Spirochaetales bacterium]